VLWFEYDLFDQTILSSLLHWFELRRLQGKTLPNLSWIVADSFPGIQDFRGLGQLTPEQLCSLWPRRRAVNERELAAGSQAWRAFSSSDPTAVLTWLTEQDDRFPECHVMTQAFAFHLKRFPSTVDGMGAVERETLSILRQGPARIDSLFGRISWLYPIYGLGDLSYWVYLRRMKDGGLIEVEGEELLPVFSWQGVPDFSKWLIRITSLGRETIAGRSDAVMESGYWNRWLGGVRVQGGSAVWRSDGRETGLPSMTFK
jgi:hypothetical protein